MTTRRSPLSGIAVHDINLTDEKFARPETAGIASTVLGICSSVRDDERRIAAASPLLNGLCRLLSAAKRKVRNS
ncbi:MAG TPA: chromate resistance protein ChrB domain-containing protein [Polyangiaceae bacterium]|nr:chromate resistance protein ChrB domain-containing protein [Polyangiaceae bacterium]